MYLLRRLARTALSCLLAVSVTLSCFYAGNEVYVSVQARKANRQEAELERIYRQGEEEAGDWEEGREMDRRASSSRVPASDSSRTSPPPKYCWTPKRPFQLRSSR